MTLTQDELVVGKNYHHNNPSNGYLRAKIGADTYHIEIDKAPFKSDNLIIESLSRYKNPLIEKCLKQLAEIGISDRNYVGKYLYNLHRRGRSRNTLRNNSIALRLFLTYLKESGRNRIKSIERNDVGGFVEQEQDRGLKPATVHNRLRCLYAFIHYLVERDILSPDLLKRKLRIKVPDTLPRAIDPDEIRQVLSVIKHPRDWALMLVLLRTGMRIGELLDIRPCDVSLKEKKIEIIEAMKNRVGRVVYLSEDALSALKQWFAVRDPQKEYLFYGKSKDKLSYTTAWQTFKKCLDEAGLSHRAYSLHCLRHTFASELLNAGMHLECVQQLLGHRCIEMTRRYARLTDNTRKEEYFKAMRFIEGGKIHGHYRRDHSLSKTPEKEELLTPDD